jgi:hypothetical protein
VVAGVLNGGHTRDRLRAAGATHLIQSIADLPALLAGASAGAAEAGSAPAVPPQASTTPVAPAPRVP